MYEALKGRGGARTPPAPLQRALRVPLGVLFRAAFKACFMVGEGQCKKLRARD